MAVRGEAKANEKICHEPCPLRWSSNQENKEVDWMEKETADSEKMYFEDLSEHIQDAIVDYGVSIIENKSEVKQLKKKPKSVE